MTRIAITIGAILLPGVASAHPDHASGGDFGLVHYLTSPFHMGLTAIAVVLAFALGRMLFHRRS